MRLVKTVCNDVDVTDWIDVPEATRRFGLSRATLYRLIAEGRVRRAKRAGDVRAYVSSSDLKEATTLRPVNEWTRSLRPRGGRAADRL